MYGKEVSNQNIREEMRRDCFFFFQAEDDIRDVERSRELGDVYKRQVHEPRRRA